MKKKVTILKGKGQTLRSVMKRVHNERRETAAEGQRVQTKSDSGKSLSDFVWFSPMCIELWIENRRLEKEAKTEIIINEKSESGP